MSLQQRERHAALQTHVQSLHNLSPLGVLARGYSLTTDKDGRPVTDSHQVKIGDTVETRLNSGKIRAKIFERLDEDTI